MAGKFEKLTLQLRKGGEMRFETAYNAYDAAKAAARWSRKGWDVEVVAASSGHGFMTCKPSARKAYWSDPDVKAHAVCKISPAFKKRIRVR
jgi:hypothetical protein